MRKKYLPFPKHKTYRRGDVLISLLKLWITLFVISVIIIFYLELKIKYMK